MNTNISLGDLISALYDAVAKDDPGSRASDLVAVCTVDLLVRQRNPRLLAELLAPTDGSN